MPRGNVKTWLFSNPTLVPSVLTDQDFLSNGYVWGLDGDLHYCFVDPQRFVLEAWEKEDQPELFAPLLANLAAAALAAWLGGPVAAIITFVSVPTLPFVLWWHYRETAKEQAAAVVVTNGPQMEYPMKGGLTNLVTAAAAAGAVAGFVQQLAVALSTEMVGGVVIGGVTVTSSAFAALVAAVGTGTNVFAIGIYILGRLSKPYDRVDGNGIADPGIGNFSWGFMCRAGAGFGSYQIGPGQAPAGKPVCCGGLVPMILNRALVYRGVGWPLVTWAFIPLTPTGEFVDPPPVPAEYIPENRPPPDWSRGLILVAGSPTWSPTQTEWMATLHGVTYAVATDGNQSPVLGTEGELVMKCHEFLDCVQRYGLKMTPVSP